MAHKFYAVQQAARTADIYIYGDIVTNAYLPGETSSFSLVQQIKDLDVDRINVHIDSYGGVVSEGWAIYTALLEHPAEIVTYGDGFVASAALYPFLAGSQRYASELSAYFFHEVMTGAVGYAKDLRAAAEEADILTDIGIQAFVSRAGMSAEQVRELMAEETWLTPAQAMDMGLATGILKADPGQLTQSARRLVVQQLFTPAPVSNLDTPPEPPPAQTAEPDAPPTICELFKKIKF